MDWWHHYFKYYLNLLTNLDLLTIIPLIIIMCLNIIAIAITYVLLFCLILEDVLEFITFLLTNVIVIIEIMFANY